MGKITGFLEIDRHDRKLKTVESRLQNFNEFVVPLSDSGLESQASRCMDCGIPYCHTGCPVNNQIPDWNDLVYKSDWKTALLNLHSTNNFPELTGRVCPAPCEASCTLNLIDEAVTIKSIEYSLVEKGWEEGWITPQICDKKTGKSIAVIGAGPAGLACAQQLVRVGHEVHLYEKNSKAGGLTRFGIPDFKLDKTVIDRRIKQMEAEGIEFHYNTHIGIDISAEELKNKHDAIVLSTGSEHPRDLPVSGRELDGVHFAMEFLTQQNRHVSNEPIGEVSPIIAKDKHVIVIGGGDTGSDCIGTSLRQGASSVVQLEIMSIPPEKENKSLTWPNWPIKMRVSSSQEEGAERDFSVMTEEIIGKDGHVTSLKCIRVDDSFNKLPNTEFELKADLVLLAMGFMHPVHKGLIKQLNLDLDPRGNVSANTENYQTSKSKVFSCGDMRRGQSLVVWAIREGRQCARSVDTFLMGSSDLPR